MFHVIVFFYLASGQIEIERARIPNLEAMTCERAAAALVLQKIGTYDSPVLKTRAECIGG